MSKKICLGMAALVLAAGCASNTARTGPATPPVPVERVSPIGLPPAATTRMVLHMTGPDFVTKAKDWPDFQEEWRATFAEHAQEAAIAFEFQKDEGPPQGTGTYVDVYVNDYRKVGIGSRVFFGVMTGNAYIDATAKFSAIGTGTVVGEKPYNTSSTAWAGVFAKMTPQQVDAIATRVFAELGVTPVK